MALHTVNLLPGARATEAALAQLRDGDAVLFHGDGAWHAAAPGLDAWARSGATLHVLAADLAACGLAERCDPRVAVVDSAGFVALTEQHAAQRAWF
ncbi:MAG: sulfurtransferase complex subunit TusB [Pseudohaliea sp.]